jgi:GNAT superfamily N-acetyltransferase
VTVTLRPLVDADIEPAIAAQGAAFEELDRSSGVEPTPLSDAVIARISTRYRHFLTNDPDGAWAATEGDAVVGAALALVRDGLWGLSLLFVDPRAQSTGVGRRLLDASLTYAAECDRGAILSTHDPRAMRLYATSNFAAYPQMEGTGALDRSRLPAEQRRVREGSVSDAEFADSVDLVVRRARHGPDQVRMASDMAMFVVDDVDGSGYGYIRDDGTVYALAATDDDTASALLWRCLAHTVELEVPAGVYHLNAEQQWAITATYQARLTVIPAGAAFWRGMTPPKAYLPSGAYL